MTDWNKTYESANPKKRDETIETWVKERPAARRGLALMEEIKTNLLSIDALRSKLNFETRFSYWATEGVLEMKVWTASRNYAELRFSDESGLAGRDKSPGFRGTVDSLTQFQDATEATTWTIKKLSYTRGDNG